MKVLLSLEAQNELDDAMSYYNLQQENLGSEFKTLIHNTIRNIQASPLLYPIIKKPIHRVVTRKFPYSIFYMIDNANDIILILSIAHQHRKPFYT
jgi:plasmid stabilization system protein ParE